jgi:hypothetical protein
VNIGFYDVMRYLALPLLPNECSACDAETHLPPLPSPYRPSADRIAYYKRQQRENILNSLIEGASLSASVLSSKQVTLNIILVAVMSRHFISCFRSIHKL